MVTASLQAITVDAPPQAQIAAKDRDVRYDYHVTKTPISKRNVLQPDHGDFHR